MSVWEKDWMLRTADKSGPDYDTDSLCIAVVFPNIVSSFYVNYTIIGCSVACMI